MLSVFIQIFCDTENNLEPFSIDSCESFIETPENLRYNAIYEKPILAQLDTSVFYSSETVEIKWSLPGDLWNTELQIIETSNAFSCNDFVKFHELGHSFTVGYGEIN